MAQNGEIIFTVTVLDEEVECVVIAVVGELVVGRRKSLEALSRDRRKIPSELSVLGQNHRPPSHEAVYERFLTHTPPRLTESSPEFCTH